MFFPLTLLKTELNKEMNTRNYTNGENMILVFNLELCNGFYKRRASTEVLKTLRTLLKDKCQCTLQQFPKEVIDFSIVYLCKIMEILVHSNF